MAAVGEGFVGTQTPNQTRQSVGRSTPRGFSGGSGSGPLSNGRKNYAPSRLFLLPMVVRFSAQQHHPVPHFVLQFVAVGFSCRRSWTRLFALICAALALWPQLRICLRLRTSARSSRVRLVKDLATLGYLSVCRLRSLSSHLARPDLAAGMIDATSCLQLDGWLAGKVDEDDGDGLS
ncbi:hypothetical protein BKA80DRAFT_124407 [Phyllosticta citrichinensis]